MLILPPFPAGGTGENSYGMAYLYLCHYDLLPFLGGYVRVLPAEAGAGAGGHEAGERDYGEEEGGEGEADGGGEEGEEGEEGGGGEEEGGGE